MKRFLLLIASILTMVSASGQRKMCNACDHSGWFKIPNVGYGLGGVYGKCPNCLQTVNKSGHMCKCRACGGHGYTEGSSPSHARRSDGTPVDEFALYVFKCLQSNSIPETQTCWGCGGTGLCKVCNGAKQLFLMGNIEPCPGCYMTGTCRTCGGSRIVQGSRPMTEQERALYLKVLRGYMQ
jgi:hypothetical protein